MTPDSGPVGSTVSIHGFCGFRASAFVAVLARGPIGEGAGVAHVLKPATFLKSTPFGHFSTKVQIPAVGSVDGEPITPGGYFVRVGCFPGTPVVILPEQLFEVTASQRGGGPGR